MPAAPSMSPALPASAQANAGIDPANFLMAAADLHQSGALSSPVPTGVPLQTGKMPKGSKRLKVIK